MPLPIQISGNGIEITDIMHDFVVEKFDRLSKHAVKILSAHVVLSVDKPRHIAEAKLDIPNTEVYAKVEAKNMYEAVDLLIEKLVRQLDKHRGKTTEKLRRQQRKDKAE
jgi:putative sigma-54 modulation protein